jgi:hypothetical protein
MRPLYLSRFLPDPDRASGTYLNENPFSQPCCGAKKPVTTLKDLWDTAAFNAVHRRPGLLGGRRRKGRATAARDRRLPLRSLGIDSRPWKERTCLPGAYLTGAKKWPDGAVGDASARQTPRASDWGDDARGVPNTYRQTSGEDRFGIYPSGQTAVVSRRVGCG